MIYPVYRGLDEVYQIETQDGSVQETVLNGSDICRMKFIVPEVAPVQIGDFILVDGKRYSFNTIPDFTKSSERKYTYECVLESTQYDLIKVLFQDGNGVSDFFLTGDLAFFVSHLVTNMNRVGGGWTAGQVKDGTATLNLGFNNENCLAVMQRLCSEYKVNFKITDNKVISVDNFTQQDIPSFAYGEDKGLYELSRTVVTSKNHITRLYAYGADKNIPANYRGYSSRLKLAAGYLEQNVDKYGIIEGSQTFDHIYPRFNGDITSLGADNFTFYCSTIDFDLNDQAIPSVKPKVRFNTGQLAGYEFEISSYDPATKKIVILPNTKEKAYSDAGALSEFSLPNATIYASAGDKFVFVDIVMPDAYITAAENELLAAATEYLSQNSDPRAQHELKISPMYVMFSGVSVKAGDYINIKDDYLNIDKNDLVLMVTRSLHRSGWIEVKLADSVAPQVINRNIAAIEELKRVIVRNQLGDIFRTNRGLKSMDETLAMIFDADGYFNMDKIRPLSVETYMIAVGGKSGQFALNCYIEPNYNANVNHCRLGAGTLIHFSIEDTIRTWAMTESTRTDLVSATAYYIYAKCSRIGNGGQLILDTVQRRVDSDPNYYYFLVGVLNSVVNGMRLVSLTYGSTTINGGQIRTGRIASYDGLTYMDLNSGVIQGDFVFTNGNSVEDSITDVANSVSNVEGDVAALQNQVSNLESSTNSSFKHFSSQPVPPYRVNDLWSNGHNLYTCVVTRLSGSFTMSDWALNVDYDNTVTRINGGVTTTGRLLVADINGVVWGGLRGATGVNGDEVGFWLGSNFENRNTAPLRFYHNGGGYMAGWEIKKDNNTGNWYFAKDTGDASTSAGMAPADFPFYAGATYANRANANFWVKPDGSARMTKASLYTASSGKRIEIDSVNNRMVFYDSASASYVLLDTDQYGRAQIVVNRNTGFFENMQSYIQGGRLGVARYYLDGDNPMLYPFFDVYMTGNTTNDKLKAYMNKLPKESDMFNYEKRALYVDIATGQIFRENGTY